MIEVKVGRKRLAKPNEWKRNKAKLDCVHGKQYTDVNGKVVAARSVQQSKHSSSCRMACETKISEDERQFIDDDFWTLEDLGKRHYFARTTERLNKVRTRKD